MRAATRADILLRIVVAIAIAIFIVRPIPIEAAASQGRCTTAVASIVTSATPDPTSIDRQLGASGCCCAFGCMASIADPPTLVCPQRPSKTIAMGSTRLVSGLGSSGIERPPRA